ncbi:unnamed protein product [Cuscuta europaea]|uniref:DUF1985 domain-containing protein n=1 Tax=Cuscuta europaea TaxID=41803 RepID=A0A9P0YKE8_CUSEU|nr:unnamed protein product [Cuscuta europaea]
MLKIEDMSWNSGQLLLGFVGNYVTEVNGNADDSVIRFHIQNSVISFQKADMATMCGLKFGSLKPNMSEEPEGDIWRIYFGNKATVSRADIQNALKSYESTDEGRMTKDGVKLALLHILSYCLFGNQTARPMKAYYINLVNDLDAFNAYPWGDDVWNELVDKIKQSCEALDKGKGDKVTFPGYMVALQWWAFETFPGLAKAGLCKLIKGRENILPRTLKWEFKKKPTLEVLSQIIFKNDKFEWTQIVPTEEEIAMIEGNNDRGGHGMDIVIPNVGRLDAEKMKAIAEKGKKRQYRPEA